MVFGLGTSKKDEEDLRHAAGVDQDDHRQSYSSAGQSSAYETADDAFSHDDDTIRGERDEPHKDNDTTRNIGHEGEDHSGEEYEEHVTPVLLGANSGIPTEESPEELENELNRKYTLERIASRRSVLETAEDEQRKSLQLSTHEKVHFDQDSVKEIHIADLTWDSDADPANPKNWPAWKRWTITCTVAFVCLSCSLGSSLYVSGVPQLMVEFHASQELCIAGLSLYILGLALGPIFTSPLSEIFGRKYIYWFSVPTGMLFTMGVGLSPNIRTLLVLRFFTGYFASPALSIASGTISDLWSSSPVDLSFAVALFCLAPFLGPVIGPIIGGFASQEKGWKWSSAWVSLMFSGSVLPFVFMMPETLKPAILSQRAKKRGYRVIRPTVDKAFIKKTLNFILFRPLHILLVEPIVLVMSIYTAFVFAVLFGFFEAFPIIFTGVYHFDQGKSGLPFIGVGVGLILGIVFYVFMDKFYYYKKNPDGTRGKHDGNGNFVYDPPESKLLIGKIGAVCLPISLFWLGWTGRESVHWIAPTLSGVPFGFGLVLIFLSVVLYFAIAFPPVTVASAFAANNLLRYILASVFPLFTVQMYERLHIGWASSLFAFIALAMVPVPFVFEKYGPKLRSISKFGYAALARQAKEAKEAKEAAEEAAKREQGQATPATAADSTDEKYSDNSVVNNV